MITLPHLHQLEPTSLPAYATLPTELAGQGPRIEALYLHIPFCTTKCHYCDFYSVAGHLDRANAFLDALEREMIAYVQFFGRPRPKTIFIGGGTPTLLSPAQLERLLKLLWGYVDGAGVQEFTIEANPNTFDRDRAHVLVGGGVNRISFGAQSFNPPELRMLQRDHDPACVAQAFDVARQAGLCNINLDLIFGIPGQTRPSWDFSLTRALELEPTHMSCYSLTYEPNTAMTARLRAGDFQKLDEETELALFEDVYHRLNGAGFTRYETSNYARGMPCQHNLAYWKAGNWIGWGPSAGSHVAVTRTSSPAPVTRASSPASAEGPSRSEPHTPGAESTRQDSSPPAAWQWKNVASLAHYLEAWSPSTPGLAAPRPPIVQMEALPRPKWAAGAAIFWLRLNEGLDYLEFWHRTGVDARPTLEKVLTPFAQDGFAELLPGRARITQRGVAVSNHILARVLAALEA